MKRSAHIFLLATSLVFAGFAGQQTSPSSPHGNSQDVPRQKPSTENPDVGKGELPRPSTDSTKDNDSKSNGDVPHQKPGTDNPDVAKDKRAPKPATPSGTDGSKQKAKDKT